MKHVINILVIGILVYFAIALPQFIESHPNKDGTANGMVLLWMPLIAFMFLWGIKLREDYE